MKLKSKLGDFGEKVAVNYLKEKDYTICERNFRMGRYGEIDIIAEKEGFLIFIEVKTRVSKLYGSPREAVTLAKQRKIRRVAEYYLMITGKMSCMPVIAFDCIEIISDGKVVKELNHIQHCF